MLHGAALDSACLTTLGSGDEVAGSVKYGTKGIDLTDNWRSLLEIGTT